MKFQELLAGKQINWDRVKLIRHNLTKEEIAANYERGYLELYQSVQNHARFRDCDMVISFLGTEGTNGVFQGCYRVGGSKPYIRTKFPEDFVPDSGMTEEKSVVYELVKTDLLADMKDRLVIDWGKGTINWCQNGTTEKELLEIRPAVSEISFSSYDKVLLSFETLHKIVYNKAAYKEWEEKLSAVAGVYLITDTKTGKHYVGSASGEQGGSGADGASMLGQSTAAISASRSLSPPMLTIAIISSIPFWRYFPSRGISMRYWSTSSCIRKSCGRFSLG